MGGRVQKIAFIIFALLFVAIMAVLNTSVLNMATGANKTLTTTVSTSDSSSLDVYNDADVYGSTVQNCATKPSSIISSSISVFVRTGGDDSYREYTAKGTYKEPSSSKAFINTNAMFHSNLITNANGVTVGILFYQDNVPESERPSSADFSRLTVVPATTGTHDGATSGNGEPASDSAQNSWGTWTILGNY